MKKRIIGYIFHPLIAGSSIIFIGSFISNIASYLFNLLMGRILSVSEYGLLTSLSSMIVLFGIFQVSFTSIFARFSAKYKAKKDASRLSMLISNGFRVVILFDLALFVVLLISIPGFGNFLHVKNLWLVFMIFLSVFVSILYSLPYGVLQGEMRFVLLSFLNILAPMIKILVAVPLVVVGYSVFGAIVGILLSALIPLVIVAVIVKKQFKRVQARLKETEEFFTEFKKYSTQLLIASLGITIISNADIVLVRHFFDPVTSGQYAALSLMGKAIFYMTAPIYFVLFPLIAHKREKGEKVFETLLLAFAIVALISITISFVYFTFPHLVLNIFFPAPAYKALAPYLGPYSVYIVIFSIAYLFSNFFLSIGKTGVYKFNLIAGLLFVVGIIFFHKSLFEVIANLFIISLLLMISLLIYYLYHGRD